MPTIGDVEIFSYAYERNYGVHTLAIETPRFVVYYSYETPIVLLDKTTRTLYVDTYPYSRTTNKHRGWAIQHAEGHYFINERKEDNDLDIEVIMKERMMDWLSRVAKSKIDLGVLLVAEML